MNLIFWHQETFGITAADRASHLAGVGFDAAVWEIWPHLTAGATLVLVDEQTRTSADLLRDWLVKERITVAFVPTIFAEPMLAHSWPQDTALRYLLTGGEALHRHPPPGLPFTVVNNYGPTECTVVATSGVFPAATHRDGHSRRHRPSASRSRTHKSAFSTSKGVPLRRAKWAKSTLAERSRARISQQSCRSRRSASCRIP